MTADCPCGGFSHFCDTEPVKPQHHLDHKLGRDTRTDTMLSDAMKHAGVADVEALARAVRDVRVSTRTEREAQRIRDARLAEEWKDCDDANWRDFHTRVKAAPDRDNAAVLAGLVKFCALRGDAFDRWLFWSLMSRSATPSPTPET